MFNVGGGELMLIALVALLVLGPDKLPDFARKSARILGQVRQVSQGFQNEMKSVMNFDDDTEVAQASRGPRLVGPIETGPEPASSEPASDPSTAPVGDADPSASSHDGPSEPDEGEPTSGTSAA